MKKITLAAALAALVVAPGLAGVAFAASDNDTVFSHDKFSVERTLADRGIQATSLEEWGQVIVATVKTADGTVTNQFFDRDTLQAVRADGGALNAAANATRYGRGEFPVAETNDD